MGRPLLKDSHPLTRVRLEQGVDALRLELERVFVEAGGCLNEAARNQKCRPKTLRDLMKHANAIGLNAEVRARFVSKFRLRRLEPC